MHGVYAVHHSAAVSAVRLDDQKLSLRQLLNQASVTASITEIITRIKHSKDNNAYEQSVSC